MNCIAKKLLIVDERALARRVVRLAATSPHDTVLECASPDEAVRAANVFKPDCVMMGVSLPAPGTFTAIKSIRKQHPEMRILAVNALDEGEARHEATKAGASAYVTTDNLSELFLLAAPDRLAATSAHVKKIRRRKHS
jgi:DNA-binding NarL/FixJ family response regulator